MKLRHKSRPFRSIHEMVLLYTYHDTFSLFFMSWCELFKINFFWIEIKHLCKYVSQTYTLTLYVSMCRKCENYINVIWFSSSSKFIYRCKARGQNRGKHRWREKSMMILFSKYRSAGLNTETRICLFCQPVEASICQKTLFIFWVQPYQITAIGCIWSKWLSRKSCFS